ncbi:MAG: ribonuclease III domain-containing protein [Nannocystales bacterium]
MSDQALLQRSVRTLAWLGDAAFERDVRWRVCARGDHPVDRLDSIKADVVRAEAQSALLDIIEPELTEDERSVVRRGRNAKTTSIRGKKNTQTYRSSTGFEALIAHWALVEGAWSRYEALVVPHLEPMIDAATAKRAKRPRRG